jgi:TctA family transporter
LSVIAPSAANNATLGGALVPTLALGIPGSLMSAMLLSALVLLGLAPGPRLLLPERDGGHLTLVFALVWFMVIGNIVAVGVSYAASGLLVRITQIRAQRLVPFLRGRGEIAIRADRRHRVTDRQCGELFATGGEKCKGTDHESAGA